MPDDGVLAQASESLISRFSTLSLDCEPDKACDPSLAEDNVMGGAKRRGTKRLRERGDGTMERRSRSSKTRRFCLQTQGESMRTTPRGKFSESLAPIMTLLLQPITSSLSPRRADAFYDAFQQEQMEP